MAPATQAFVAVPGVVGVIDSVVAGAIVAIAALELDLGTGGAVAAGGIGFLISVGVFVAVGERSIKRATGELQPLFPTPLGAAQGSETTKPS